MRLERAVVVVLAILAILAAPAAAAAADLDVMLEHSSATFPNRHTAEASTATLALDLAPDERTWIRLEVPVLRARSSQTLLTRLGFTPRVRQALAEGNPRLSEPVQGEWHSGLGDARLAFFRDLAGGGAKLFRMTGELEVKAPTGEEERGLGSGAWDARIGLAGERRFWSMTLFGGAGYNRLGDTARVVLDDVADGYLGIESEPGWRGLRGSVWVEGHGEVLPGGGERAAAGLGLRSSGMRPWKLSGTAGLTDGSEDFRVLFGVSVATLEGGASRKRPAGARPE
ncbi:MAG TPA: hypothetical protein VE078_17740 [Thermoanaerobaculia bacterium]|nr:hypothetical protein [Thermoanaerobaculia bacterium]